MDLFLQDPTDSQTTYLVEAMLSASTGATKGGGGFAFVSAGGVQLLLANEKFGKFLSAKKFELIIGTDSITNTKSLTALAEIAQSYPKMRIRAFLNPKAGALYHPKFCWFAQKVGGTLITGSGNMTRGGLRGNWEAFTVNELSAKEVATVEMEWDAWTAKNAGNLLPITDQAVVDRCAKNVFAVAAIQKAVKSGALKKEVAIALASDDTGPLPEDQSEVLIAEIPQAGTRWSQANFDLATFKNYFGATPGSAHWVLFYHVENGETLPEAPEHRPSVSVKSKNFRYELEAAAHLKYPTAGRPIGVFVRVAARTFWYDLLMPNEAAHATIAAYLDQNHQAKKGRMRRVTVPFSTLEALLPNLPLVRLAAQQT